MKQHECVDCLALPEKPTPAEYEALLNDDGQNDAAPYVGPFRPPAPRKIVPGCGPRSKRCATHQRALKRRRRQQAREKRSEKVYGLAPGVRAQLMELQGGKCPICQCGLDMDSRGRFRATTHDHDHDLAAQHDHPIDQGCEECVRGLVCNWCNGELMSRIDLEAARRLVAYYENPPMARLLADRRERDLYSLEEAS